MECSSSNQYPYPSNVSATSFINVKPSDRDEYILWKGHMESLLKGDGMYGYIDGTLVRPQMSVSGKEKERWIRQDALVKGFILGSLSKQTFGYGNHLTERNAEDDYSAKDLWDELQTIAILLPLRRRTEKDWKWKEHEIKHSGSEKLYKIKPDQSDKFVMVKKISNPKKIEEIEILKKIQHANIVKMIDHFESGTSTLILYPYYDNGSLADHLVHRNQAPPSPVLDWPKRIRIAFGVAQGLKYMHHRSPALFHRNLKSSDILLDGDFNPKIANFESAKFVKIGDEYAEMTEQDEKKDVNNFGVILLELLTGKAVEKKKRVAKLAHAPIHDVLDQAIKIPMYEKDTRIVFKLASWCTDEKTEAQPSDRLMDRVLERLEKCNHDFA